MSVPPGGENAAYPIQVAGGNPSMPNASLATEIEAPITAQEDVQIPVLKTTATITNVVDVRISHLYFLG